MENHILPIICPQDGTEVLESPDLVDGSEPLTAEGHRSLEASIACRNPTNVGTRIKLRGKMQTKVLEVWKWI